MQFKLDAFNHLNIKDQILFYTKAPKVIENNI